MVKYALDRTDSAKTATDWALQLQTSNPSKQYSVDMLHQQTNWKSLYGSSNAYEMTGEQATGARALLIYLIQTVW